LLKWTSGVMALGSLPLVSHFGSFFLATDDPAVEDRLKQRYGEKLHTYSKRTLSRGSQEGIQDAFVDLMLLAQGSEIIGSFSSSFSAVASVFHRAPLHIIDKDAPAPGESVPEKKPYRECAIVAKDPSEDTDLGFFLIGTWDAWNSLTRFVPMSNGSTLFRTRLSLKAPSVERFQILQDSNQKLRFYPDQGVVLGPDATSSASWEVHIPQTCKWLEVDWDPLGERHIEWRCLASSGRELKPSPLTSVNLQKDTILSGGFFLVGSWDNWQNFTEMRCHSGGKVYRKQIKVAQPPSVVEFQILQNRSWEQRFYPARGSNRVLGPDRKHGANWQVPLHAGCSNLEITWDLRGQRCVRWSCLDPHGAVLSDSTTTTSPSSLSRGVGNHQYYAVGSWNDWREFIKLEPTMHDSPPFQVMVELQEAMKYVEFQIAMDCDWGRRFYPGGGNTDTVMGPGNGHGANWQLPIPKGCKYLLLQWDPRGSRKVTWKLLSHYQDAGR